MGFRELTGPDGYDHPGMRVADTGPGRNHAMRVAVIAPPWLAVPPPGYGGIETVLDTLCRGLDAAGHDVLLHTTGDSSCPVVREWTFDEAVGTAQASPAAELRHVIDGYRAAAHWEADVIHDHTIMGPFFAESRSDIPVATTNHGPFDDVLAPLYRSLAGRIPIVAISRDQAASARDVPVAAVIHHGVDLDLFPAAGERGDHAVFLGRMSATKGVHTAIQVARAAGRPLRIAAKMREPRERAYFEAEVEPLLGDDIEYLGEVGGEAGRRLLAGAACLLNPIAWPEPFGMVMIEALACGTPVVATPRGAAPEIVDDGVTGFLRADVDGLAEALARVDEIDPERCRMAAARRFSMSRLTHDHFRLYGRLLSAAVDRRRRRPA
jgi:glycosyltransferase involved in cell wall biosynthesis